MAARATETSRYQQHQQQQQQQRYTPKVYTLYPDPPPRRPFITQLPPSPSQIQNKGKEKHPHNQQQQQQHQHQQKRPAYTTLAKDTPPSPVSPSSPAPAGFTAANEGVFQRTKDKPADQAKCGTYRTIRAPSGQMQQQTRQPSPPACAMVQWDRTGASKKVVPIVQTSHYQYQQQPHYGGSVPRQSISLPPIQKQTQGTQNQGRVAPAYTAGQGQGQSGATLKQSATPTPSPAGHQSTYNMKQNSPSPVASPSAVSPRQQPFSITSAAASASGAVQSLDRPSLMMDIPSSSLYLSFDDVAGHQETYSRNQERHQQQALRYQQKLQQKPSCQQDDEDTDDDSESGSIVSFQRSIHRLSMTYNGRPGMLNIRLFGPHQRTQVAKHGRSVSGSSIVSVSGQQKDQKDDKRLQQRQPRQQQDLSTRSRPSDESDRPRIVRAYTEETLTTTRPNEVQVPGRSTSADNIYIRDGRPRQQVQETQHQQMHQPQIHHHHYPKQYHTSPSSPTPAQSHPTLRHQHNPRPSHESAQSMRSLQSSSNNRPDTMQRGRGDGAMSPNGDRLYSQNPARPGNLSPHPLPTTARGGVGAGRAYGNIHINMHPAHHFPTHGYVRPEEAVGPSNPMPEKAEDYVRQGIEYHELGEISKATHYFRTAAELGDPVGMLMYGLSVRHGWGCVANRVLAFQYLQKSAEHAVGDLNSRDSFASTAAKGELVLAIYELGICFRHGWGVEKNKKTAAYYFEIAANLGDPDAQSDLAWCFFHGVGVKKDMHKSAKYYRLAAAQGLQLIGNQWIWKDKYGGPSSPSSAEKTHLYHQALQPY